MFQVVISTATFVLVLIAFVKGYFNIRKFRLRIEELERQLVESESFLSRHGKLANEIAHEIKNPITAILCSAEALDLMLGESLAADHRKTLRYIKEYGDNLLRLVSNFIDVSRADTGNISNNPKPVEVAPLVESVVGLLSASAERKEIEVRVSGDGELKAIVDPIHFKQIVFNLLHNAIKFTGRHGEVRISIESDFPNPYLKIALKDNGTGIPATRISSLFDPYCRADTHLSGMYAAIAPGVGLGLALCKRLVELAGGKISVESQVNIGTCFEFFLPIAIDEGREADNHEDLTVAVSAEARPLVGQAFLLVNGKPYTFSPVKSLIEAWGGRVDIAAEAGDALRRAQSNVYDAIMLDEELEQIDWEHFIFSLRDNGADKNVAIIIAGDRFFPTAQKEMLSIDTILSKPFNGKALLEALVAAGKYDLAH